MRKLGSLAAPLTLALFLIAAPVAADSLEYELELMMEWFAGEFDNHQQYVDEIEAENPPEQLHEWIHSIFHPVELPVFGDNVFYVEQYIEGDPTNIYRNRIYSFSINEEVEAIQLTIYSFKDHEAVIGAHLDETKLEGLTMDDVLTLPGCEVFWKKQADNFIGWMPDGACRVPSRRSGKIIVIDDDLVLTKNEIWIGDRAEDEDGNYIFGNKLGNPAQAPAEPRLRLLGSVHARRLEGVGRRHHGSGPHPARPGRQSRHRHQRCGAAPLPARARATGLRRRAPGRSTQDRHLRRGQ